MSMTISSTDVVYTYTENPYNRPVVDYKILATVPVGTIKGEGEVLITVPLEVNGVWHMHEIRLSARDALKFAQRIGRASDEARVS